MRLKTLLTDSIALATIAHVTAQERCGSNFPEPEAVQAASSLRSAHRSEGFSSSFLGKRAEGLLIPTYLHVVEDEAHMRVLNETFAPHNIQFVVKNTSHTVNDAWTRQARIKEKAEALRQGGYDELNIYFETGMMTNAGSATGICSFPVEDPWNTGINGTSWYTYDGCHTTRKRRQLMRLGTGLGSSMFFDGFDCNGQGDYIDDTRATQVATVGCLVEQDSCPDQSGLDPIHNYMDYSKHDCLSEFTPLQEERMYRSFNTLRLGR
ncbi:Extracellular metalloprotease [Colletotrichum viniferum]|nr:Extracellular metalloprotease [Colletotrichum viniferum]